MKKENSKDNKEKKGKKNFKIIILIILIIISISCIVFYINANKNLKEQIKNPEIKYETYESIIEYGSNIYFDPEVYFECENCEGIEYETDIEIIENEVIEVGKYYIKFFQKNLETTVIIFIEDTTKPVIDLLSDISVNFDEGDDIEVDFYEFIEVIELSGYEIIIDDSDIDLTKSGEYDITYTVIDDYNNEVSQTIKFKLEINPKITTSTSTSSGSSSGGSSSSGSSSNSGSSSSGSSNSESSSSSSGSSSSGTTTEPAEPAAPAYTSADTAAEADMLKLINEQRAAVGKSALVYDATLYSGAYIRAMELIELFSHTRPDGSMYYTAGTGISGENVYKGYSTSASSAMSAFMNSSGHAANIVSDSYTRVAVKRVYYNNNSYWVQLFGR